VETGKPAATAVRPPAGAAAGVSTARGAKGAAGVDLTFGHAHSGATLVGAAGVASAGGQQHARAAMAGQASARAGPSADSVSAATRAGINAHRKRVADGPSTSVW
jgi:hypothetical protein